MQIATLVKLFFVIHKTHKKKTLGSQYQFKEIDLCID